MYFKVVEGLGTTYNENLHGSVIEKKSNFRFSAVVYQQKAQFFVM